MVFTTELSWLEWYVGQINSLSEELLKGEASVDFLDDLFADFQMEWPQEDPKQLLLHAERAFFRKDYEEALKYYIRAKELPNFQFFCYRCSAYIAYERHDIAQANHYVEKALETYPEDPFTMDLKNKLNEESLKLHKLQTDEEINPLDQSLSDQAASTVLVCNGDETCFVEDKKALQEELSHRRETSNEKDVEGPPIIDRLLKLRIEEFQQQRAHLLTHYLRRARCDKRNKADLFTVLSGWGSETISSPFGGVGSSAQLAEEMVLHELPKASTGLFLRWQGYGIAINPSRGFLKRLHSSGLFVTDIDAVIVTHSDPSYYADIEQIHTLNYQLNKISSERRVIHYFLHQQSFLKLSSLLKPHFKQERNTLHQLELFDDSPEVEKMQMNHLIHLRYFPTDTRAISSSYLNSRSGQEPQLCSALGIRLDFTRPSTETSQQPTTTRFGYLSSTAWSPLLGHYMGRCDLLMAAFGNTDSNDYDKLAYKENCLGYYGSISLAEELKPALLLCGEFDGREGDIRLEICNKLRQELKQGKTGNEQPIETVILPADKGMQIDLNSMKVRCSVGGSEVAPEQVRVVKSAESFDRLLYLAPCCLLE